MGSQLLSNMAQVLSVGYRAGFGCRNKVGLVTVNTPSTITFPPKFSRSKHNRGKHSRSLSTQLTGTSPA